MMSRAPTSARWDNEARCGVLCCSVCIDWHQAQCVMFAACLTQICLRRWRRCVQELGHLYHYYIWGEQGNRASGGAAAREGRLPNGEPFPDIVLRYQVRRAAPFQPKAQCTHSGN